MEEKKIKTKFQESKFYKGFRRLTSLGLAGIAAAVFPNEIVAWLSAAAGALYGKGIIGFAALSGIVTFLGSAAGLLIQKIVLAGLTFLFSNIILKQGKRLISFLGKKIKNVFTKRKNRKSQQKEMEKTLEKKIEPVQVVKTVEKQKEEPKVAPVQTVAPIAAPAPVIEKPKVKTLGVHPSMKK